MPVRLRQSARKGDAMRIKGLVSDLYCHMLLVGIAEIVSLQQDQCDPVTFGWENPETMVLKSLTGDLDAETIAEHVHRYITLTIEELPTIGQQMQVDKGKHSPLLSYIPALKPERLKEQMGMRQQITDAVFDIDPLFIQLAGSFGLPSYWFKGSSKITDFGKAKSHWEMAPSNRGSDFLQKYFKLAGALSVLPEEEIANRLHGAAQIPLKEDKEERNTNGLHAPGATDALLSWIALHGIALFGVRPTTTGHHGAITVGTLTAEGKDGTKTFFTLPVTSKPVTLSKYRAICRSSAIAEIAAGYLGHKSPAKAISWMNSNGIEFIYLFEKGCRNDTVKVKEYYAYAGEAIQVGDR